MNDGTQIPSLTCPPSALPQFVCCGLPLKSVEGGNLSVLYLVLSGNSKYEATDFFSFPEMFGFPTAIII